MNNNNNYSNFLKNVEKTYLSKVNKKFKIDDNTYRSFIKERSASLDINNYKIIKDHTLEEYFNNYQKYLGSNIIILDSDELWLMDPKKEYWEIKNDSKALYFEVPTKTLMFMNPYGCALTAFLLVVGIVTGVLCGTLLKGDSGGESEPELPLPDPGNPLNEYTWDEINRISKKGLASEYWDIDDPSVNFKYVQLKHQGSIGVGNDDQIIIDDDGDGFLEDGSCYQTVRMIGYNHDSLAEDNSKTAGITFQFVNFISDTNGRSIAGIWNDLDDISAAYNYNDTTINKLLNQSGQLDTSIIGWYQAPNSYDGYDGSTRSTQLKNSVINMLPNFVSSLVKTVTKEISIYDDTNIWHIKSYDYKVFLLSYPELNDSTGFAEGEGYIYDYWKNHMNNTDRCVMQVLNNPSDYLSNFTAINDAVGFSKNFAAYGNAIYNYSNGYITRSPACNGTALRVVDDNGAMSSTSYLLQTFSNALSITPAFCI